MKTKLVLSFLVWIALAAAAQTAITVREMMIPVKAIPSLQAAKVRVVDGRIFPSRQVIWNVELLNTNGLIVDRREVVFDVPEMRKWLNATSPNVAKTFTGLILTNILEQDTNAPVQEN